MPKYVTQNPSRIVYRSYLAVEGQFTSKYPPGPIAAKIGVQFPSKGGGGDKTYIEKSLYSFLWQFLERYISDCEENVMFPFYKDAVTSAPFWDPARKYRPHSEGIHLQESGKLYRGDKLIGKVTNILGPNRMAPVSDDEMVYIKNIPRSGRKFHWYVTFTRERAYKTKGGEDRYYNIAALIHEYPESTGYKWLSNLIKAKKPYHQMKTILEAYIKNPTKRARYMRTFSQTSL